MFLLLIQTFVGIYGHSEIQQKPGIQIVREKNENAGKPRNAWESHIDGREIGALKNISVYMRATRRDFQQMHGALCEGMGFLVQLQCRSVVTAFW